MPHAEVNILDEMEELLEFYAWSLNAADFCTGNGHLKRKLSVCFTGSFPYLKILNAQSGCPATIYHLTNSFQKNLLNRHWHIQDKF